MLLCLICMGAAFATVVQSVPTDRKQSDGKILTVTPYGDEKVTWYRTTDGYTLLINKSNDYVYAIPDGKGGIKVSDMIAHNPQDRTTEEISFLARLQKQLFFSAEQINLMKQFIEANIDYSKKVAKIKAGSDEIEDYKMVVILMSFNDYEFTTPREDVDNLFNQVGYSKNGHPGSVHDYFLASSAGKLNLSATVVGPYVADSSIYYYGKSGTRDYYGYSYQVNDLNVKDLIEEAVRKADDDVDFSQYTNGDPSNYVSCVYVLYAGYSQAVGSNPDYLIWPHRSSLGNPITLDGVKINDYGCSSELESYVGSNSPMKIGTICHEFSHVLGQPDYYDSNYESQGSAFHPGDWDLMAGGNYNGNGAFPPLWNAMERSVRNYVDIETITTLDTTFTLEKLATSSHAYRLNYENNGMEYFLLENRQKSGWDYHLPGHGMLIFRVDRSASGWNSNCSNCDSLHLGFELITANETEHYAQGYGSYKYYNYNGGQPFPGTTNNRSFTDTSSPSSKAYAGDLLNKPLYRISENSQTGNITFFVGDTTGTVDINSLSYTFTSDTLNMSAQIQANGLSITEKGFTYATDIASLNNSSVAKITDNSSSNTSVKADLTNLTAGETYYIRPYAKTSSKTSYGEILKIVIPCQSIKTFPYETDFTQGIPQCFDEENTIYVSNHWKTNDDGQAYIKSQSYGSSPIILITSPLDLTNLDKPAVIYSYLNKNVSNNSDRLKVYYKTSLTSNWIQLKEHTYTNQWTTDTVELPVKGKTIYIGFGAELRGSDGVYIDYITVTDKNIASWPETEFISYDYITDNSATLTANVLSEGYTTLTDKGFVISPSNNPTLNDIVISAGNTSLGQYTLTATGLEPSTLYHVRAYATNEGLVAYSDDHTFMTKCDRIKDFAYEPDLNSDDTLCFSYEDNKLILPILDLSDKDSMAVIYTLTPSDDASDGQSCIIYYRNGIQGEWETLYEGTEISDGFVRIPAQGHQNETSYIAFENAHLPNSGTNGLTLTNLKIEALLQKATVTTLSVTSPSYNSLSVSANVTNEGLAPVTEKGICYSTSNNPTIKDKKITAGSGSGEYSCTIGNLEVLTEYYVRAYATNSFGTSYGQVLSQATQFIPITNNTISADQTICEGREPQRIDGSDPKGGSGEYEFLWIMSSDAENWIPCNVGSINTNKHYEPGPLTATRYFRRIATSNISVDTSNIVTITVNPLSQGGAIFKRGKDTVSQYDNVSLELVSYVGDILYWERLRPGYDWLEIENSNGMTSYVDNPEDIGTYAYRATVQSGVCAEAVSEQIKITVVQGVGLNTLYDDLNVTVTPNPSSGIVTINCSEGLYKEKVLVTVNDTKGSTVYSKEIFLSNDNILNLSHLPEGTYTVTLSSNNIHKNTKLIITK